MSDESGVMGNLPRSRPGRRSDKRGGAKPAEAGTTAASAATAKKTTAKPRAAAAAKPKAAPKKPPAAAPKPAAARPRVKEAAGAPPKSKTTTDPVTGAVILAGRVVEGGLKVAGGILKRLPKP